VDLRAERLRVAAICCGGLALIIGTFAFGAAFLPPRYEARPSGNYTFCPVPAFYSESTYGDDSYIPSECGEKIDHHIRVSAGTTTLAVPIGLLALLLWVQYKIRPAPS
jgi:hypothetical protein